MQTITAQYAYCYRGVSAGWRDSIGKAASGGAWELGNQVSGGAEWRGLSVARVPRAQWERVSSGVVGASRGQNESYLACRAKEFRFLS